MGGTDLATRLDRGLAARGAASGALDMITPELMIAALTAYKGLQTELDRAMPDQIMDLEGKKFRKKGYWRAVALAFNLNVELVSEERDPGSERFKDGRANFGHKVLYRATHPSGRSQIGDGACYAIEKARRFKCPHPEAPGSRRTKHFPHSTCPDFDPEFQWRTLPADATEHNVRGHAHTRGYNRAVSNLVGFGEVSAEEVEHDEHGATTAPPEARQAGASSTQAAAQERRPAHGQPAAAAAEGVTTIDRPVLTKKGKSNKGPWTRYWVHFADGRDGSTFSDTIGAEAQEAQASGAAVNPDLEPGEKGNTIKGWRPLAGAAAESRAEPPHPDEPVTGPEKILTVRRVETDKGSRWVIQTEKRVLISETEEPAQRAVEIRKAVPAQGIVPEFEVVPTPSGGSVNRLKGFSVQAIVVAEPREPGSDG